MDLINQDFSWFIPVVLLRFIPVPLSPPPLCFGVAPLHSRLRASVVLALNCIRRLSVVSSEATGFRLDQLNCLRVCIFMHVIGCPVEYRFWGQPKLCWREREKREFALVSVEPSWSFESLGRGKFVIFFLFLFWLRWGWMTCCLAGWWGRRIRSRNFCVHRSSSENCLEKNFLFEVKFTLFLFCNFSWEKILVLMVKFCYLQFANSIINEELMNWNVMIS